MPFYAFKLDISRDYKKSNPDSLHIFIGFEQSASNGMLTVDLRVTELSAFFPSNHKIGSWGILAKMKMCKA